MNWRETLGTWLHAIRAHRLRSGLTMLGILIGIAAVILTVGLGEGASAQIRAQINSLGTNLLIITPGRIHGRRQVLSGAAVQRRRAQVQRIIAHQRFRIAQRNRRRVGIAAVEQNLHLRLAAGAELLRIIARNHHAHQNPAAVDVALDGGVIAHHPANLEEFRSLELAHQRAALRRPVLVVDHGRYMVDIQAERETEQQQHQHGQGQGQGQAARIARDVMEFLDADGARPAVAHAAFLSSASIRATKTSSMEGSICVSFRTSMPRAASRSRTRALVPATSSTVTCRPPPNTATSRTPSSPSSARMVSRGSEASRFSRLCSVSPAFNSAGVPRAMTLPRYMRARRWQYSASSM